MTGLLSAIIFVPWVGALVVFVAGRSDSVARVLALLFSLSTAVLSAVALSRFDLASTGLQFIERRPWIETLGVDYHLGADGLGLLVVLLTAIVSPAALLAAWRSLPARSCGAFFLLLQGSALGVFLAQDFFLWFLFWELSLVPAFFLIRQPGTAAAHRAAYQFVIYTLGGSALMLLGFAALYAGTGTLDFGELALLAREGVLAQAAGTRVVKLAFLGVLLGLAVKVPLFPFHAWLPPAYAAAPAPVAMFLTGVLSKMGVYGFFRILWPIFPEELQAAAPVLLWLSLGGVVLGAFSALAQKELRRMAAYSSINHVSYCLLALFAIASAQRGDGAGSEAAAAALSGALLQMFNHGISAAALFLALGMIEARGAGRTIDDFGGLRRAAPFFSLLAAVTLFSSLGLPGLNGFVGEFLIFRGVFGLAPWAAVVGCIGLLTTAVFLLTFWQKVFHGPPRGGGAVPFAPFTGAERAVFVPLALLMVALGVFPGLLTRWFDPLVAHWAGHLFPP